MRRLVLVRHGETEGRSSVRFLGRTDSPLAEEGRDQLRRTRDELASLSFDVAFTSPLSRARESARILLERRGLAPQVVEGFREIDFGRLEGLTEPEIAAREPEFFRVWRVEKRAQGYPGGEDFEEFRRRVVAAYDGLESAGSIRGSVLLVAHRGSLRAVLSRTLGPEAWGRRDLLLDLGGWLTLREEDGSWRIGERSAR